jgi:hypothetical protein
MVLESSRPDPPDGHSAAVRESVFEQSAAYRMAGDDRSCLDGRIEEHGEAAHGHLVEQIHDFGGFRTVLSGPDG